MRTLRLLPIALVVVAIAAGFAAQQLLGVDRQGAQVAKLEIDSKAVGKRLPTTVVIPADRPSGRRPLLVFLHGRSGNNDSELDDAFFAALATLGSDAPLVAFPYGDDHSYWHDRADGDWGRYVTREVIPAVVKRFGADPRRVAIGGISMGGFGAFDIARLRPSEFCAVGGHSAALWTTAGDTAPGAFDDSADFARHDVIALARRRGRAPWRHAHLWLDGGTADPFRSAGEAFARALGIRMRHWPGGHEGSYWSAHYADYLRFYARALARCS